MNPRLLSRIISYDAASNILKTLGGGGGGTPTLLELRAAVRSVAARARVIESLSDAALPPSGVAPLTAAAAASRCLTALYRAAAAHQASGDSLTADSTTDGGGGGAGGDGFVMALRLLCSAAQPYLTGLHRWLDAGELSDPAGELFVAAGPAAAAAVGTEAHWEEGFVLRRRPFQPSAADAATGSSAAEGEVECPMFLAAAAEVWPGRCTCLGCLATSENVL